MGLINTEYCRFERFVPKATSAGKEALAVMREIWGFEHRMMIEEMAHTKQVLEMCR